MCGSSSCRPGAIAVGPCFARSCVCGYRCAETIVVGGFGSGGARENAGRKKKAPRERVIAGTATPEERELAIHPPPIVRVPRPIDLSGAARDVWNELAPLAEFER